MNVRVFFVLLFGLSANVSASPHYSYRAPTTHYPSRTPPAAARPWGAPQAPPFSGNVAGGQKGFMSGSWRSPAKPAPATPIAPNTNGSHLNLGGTGSAGATLGRGAAPSSNFKPGATPSRPFSPPAAKPQPTAGFANAPNGFTGGSHANDKPGFVPPQFSQVPLKNGGMLTVKPHGDNRGYNTEITNPDKSKTILNTRVSANGQTHTTYSRVYKDSAGQTVTDYGNKKVTDLPGGGRLVETPFGSRLTQGNKTTFTGIHGESYTEVNGHFTVGGRGFDGYQRTVVINHQSVVYNFRSVGYGHVYLPFEPLPVFWWHPWATPFVFGPSLFCLWCAPVPVIGIYPTWHPFSSLVALATYGLIADIVYDNYQAQQANALAQQRLLEAQIQQQQAQLQAAQSSSDAAQIAALNARIGDLQHQLDVQNQTVAQMKSTQQIQSHMSDADRAQFEHQAQVAADALKNGQSLTLEDIIHSPDFEKQLFVMGTDREINALDDEGQVCNLAGDVIQFAPGSVPDLSTGVLKMVIETSSDTSCQAGRTVNVKTADVQDKLNDWVIKMKEKMQKAEQAHPNNG